MNRYVSLLFAFFCFEVSAQKSSYENQIDSLFNIAYDHLYIEKDSAYHYFEKIEKLAIKKEDWSTVIEALISTNRNAGKFYDLKKLNQNIQKLDSLFAKHKAYLDKLPQKLLYENSQLFDKGNYYFNINNFEEARESFRQIIATTEKLADSLLSEDHIALLSVSYSFIAKMHADETKYDMAKEFYTKNIRFIKLKTPNNTDALNGTYILLAEVYKKEGKYKLSNEYLKKVIAFDLKDNINFNRIVSTVCNLAENYINLKKADSAIYFLNLGKKHLPIGNYLEPYFYRTKAKFSLMINKPKEALEDLSTALNRAEKFNDNEMKLTIASIHNEIGELYYSLDDSENALSNFEKGLNKIGIFYDPISLMLLKNKVNVLNALSKYETAEQNVIKSIKILDSLKPSFDIASDKMNLIENAFPLFESGLESVFGLYSSNKQDSSIDNAFHYVEKSKSVLLLEALLATKATKFANIPDKLLERLNQLKSEISFIEKDIYNSDIDLVQLKDQLFELKNDHRNLIQKIETSFPSYFNLKYNTEVMSVSKTQQLSLLRPFLLPPFSFFAWIAPSSALLSLFSLLFRPSAWLQLQPFPPLLPIFSRLARHSACPVLVSSLQ